MKKFATVLLALCFALNLTLLAACKEETLLEFGGLTVEDETVAYDEQYHTLPLKGIENYEGANVSLTVETVEGGAADEQGEVGAGGTYTYIYTVSKSGYKTAVIKGTLTITRIDPKFYIPLVSNLFWDDDKPLDVNVFTNFEQQNLLTVKYYYNEAEISAGEIYMAGDYAAVVSAPQTNSYNAKTETINFTVYEPAFNVGFYVYNPINGNLIRDEDSGEKATFVRQISHNEVFDLEGVQGSGVTLSYDGYEFEGWFVGETDAYGVVVPTEKQLTSGEKYSYNKEITIVAKFKKAA